MNDLFKGMTKKHWLQSALLAGWLLICSIVFHILHVETWPAYLPVVFFFAFHFDKNQIPVIFGGGLVGLLYGLAIPNIMVAYLIPAVGPDMAVYIYLGVTLFSIILLGGISHTLFNPVTFGFVLLCLVKGPVAITESIGLWYLYLIIGGGIAVAGLYGIAVFMSNYGKKAEAVAELK